MLSDRIVSFLSRFAVVSKHDLVYIGVSVLIGLILWSAVYFNRKRVVVVRRSSGTDQLTFELSRIADALDRIASQQADRAIAAASQRDTRDTPGEAQPSEQSSRRMAYSMFGR